ncbi:hypothetical protein JCM8547_001267 [Rhodosporidiobolus lusitaniae]
MRQNGERLQHLSYEHQLLVERGRRLLSPLDHPPRHQPASSRQDEPRPKSFPPLKQRARLPSRQCDPPSPGDDPFKLHANRILRPTASSPRLRDDIEGGGMPMEVAMSFSSTSSCSTESPLRRQSAQRRPPSSLRRIATVRSAHRHSRTGSIVRGGTRKRLFAAVSASNSQESLEMARGESAGSASIYSQDSYVPEAGWRGGGVVMESEGGGSPSGENLMKEWFVGAGSPLLHQVPPSVVNSPILPSPTPEQHTHRVERDFVDAPPSPTRSACSFYSSRSSRDFSTSLPRTTTFLDARQREFYVLPSSPSIQLHAAEDSSSMSRVDSEVLLTRMTLKRLASTGFEGDALDKLGREPEFDEAGEEEEAHAENSRNSSWRDEDDEDDGLVDSFSDRYRDSYTEWRRSTSSESFGWSRSASTSSSSTSSRSSRNSGMKAWKWRPSGSFPQTGGGMSTSSSTTSLGSLRRWSKSTLMDELEREFAELSYDLQREPSAESSLLGGMQEEGGEEVLDERAWEDEEEYVCALDLFLDSDEDSPSPPPSPPPIPLVAPLVTTSRLPRFKSSSTSLRPSPLPSPTRPAFRPTAPPSLLPRPAKSRATTPTPPTATKPVAKPVRVDVGRSGMRSTRPTAPVRSGWR